MSEGQKRDEHWPVPKAVQKNPQGKQAFTEQRNCLKHVIRGADSEESPAHDCASRQRFAKMSA